MTDGREFDRQSVYHIEVKGNLDQKWSDWFDGLTITPQANDATALTGPVADQAALHGLLGKIRDLGTAFVTGQTNGEQGLVTIEKEIEG